MKNPEKSTLLDFINYKINLWNHHMSSTTSFTTSKTWIHWDCQGLEPQTGGDGQWGEHMFLLLPTHSGPKQLVWAKVVSINWSNPCNGSFSKIKKGISRKESQEKLKLKNCILVYTLPNCKFSTPSDQLSSEGYLYSTCIYQHPRFKGQKSHLQRPCNSSCSSFLTLVARKCQLRELHTGLEGTPPLGTEASSRVRDLGAMRPSQLTGSVR